MKGIKNIKLIGLGLLVGLMSIVNPKPSFAGEGDVVNEIVTLFSNFNADGMEVYLSSSVELEIDESVGIFSKTQTIQILKKFFTENGNATFNVNHKGSSSGGARYIVGNYKTDSETFRISIYIKKMDGEYLIQEITIE